MSDPTPPISRESRDEFATDRQSTNVERQSRRTRWTSRAAAAACLVLGVTVGTTYAWTDTFAAATPEVADVSANATLTWNLEANLASFSEKFNADLDARVKLKTDAIVQQAAERQVAVLLQQLDQKLTISNETWKRVDSQLVVRRN